MSIDLKAHGLRVKPLKIQSLNTCLERAETQFGEYRISPTQGKRVFCDVIFNEPNYRNYVILGECVRVEVAREAIQRHHETRVLALLEQVEGGQ